MVSTHFWIKSPCEKMDERTNNQTDRHDL